MPPGNAFDDEEEASDANSAVPVANHQTSSVDNSPVEEDPSNGQRPSTHSGARNSNSSHNHEPQAKASAIAESVSTPATPDYEKTIREATTLLNRVLRLLYPRAGRPDHQATATGEVLITPDSPDEARSLLLQAIVLLENHSGQSPWWLVGPGRKDVQNTTKPEEHGEAKNRKLEADADKLELIILRMKVGDLEDEVYELRKQLRDADIAFDEERESGTWLHYS
ncbi:hypothetical protein M436DRAFT_79678 [Aureobasidium namibiae CBS 147.97]|uniref:Uncharacterized protein n=1 Tax=Aureobasidium namibiae CBS 147.97 TaxID=1043004 RepID=A0A074WZN8_9PEZI|nr:uncharacterized protein M436DRAFT_79678 [Aureobasidium namibiae CBS 147.97]KEQ75262.1 hypothetical protein M436DRAFT_79678 [Aureobasidium namibiae CBS 147.97]